MRISSSDKVYGGCILFPVIGETSYDNHMEDFMKQEVKQ